MEKLGIELSQDLKRYTNQTRVINNKVSTVRTSIIGGQPPKTGNWIDWANTVKANLAPVSYKLNTLSVLFNFIHNIDVAAAVKGFQTYLNTICLRIKCPSPTPERPKPKPLVVTVTRSPPINWKYISPRQFDTYNTNVKVGMRVFKIMFGNKGCIDSIQFFFSDGIS